MVYNREQAAQRAEAAKTNVVGMCQQWTRTMFGAPSVGDYDGDRAADAEDGWKAARHRHPGDHNPPRGVPVYYDGGSRDNGHAAVSLGGGKIRSTDADGNGHVGTVDLAWPERKWGMRYLGWAEDLGGTLIPAPPPAKHKPVAKIPGKWAKFAHLSPYAFSNSVAGLRKARRLGYRAIDLDFQVTRDGVVICTHWGDTREFAGPLRRFDEMTWQQVRKLRAKKGRYRVRSAAFMIGAAERNGFTRIEFEAKSNGLAGRAGVERFKRIKRRADAVGIDVQVKTLTSIPGARKRLAAAREAGLTTIVLPRGKARATVRKSFAGIADFYR